MGLWTRAQRLKLRRVVALPFFKASVWRLRRAANRRRPRLEGTTVIAVTGSAGKTTAKDLTAAILDSVAPTTANPLNYNGPRAVSRTILRASPDTRYLVQEVGLAEDIERTSQVLRPAICAVTNIGSEHSYTFGSLESIAARKRCLVEGLPADGCAVLNADDPLVRAMAAHSPAPVLFYGESADADLRATDVSGRWPDRFAMTVTYGDESVRVTTRLIGTHWVSTVLAAIGIGVACGVRLEVCAAAIANVETEFNRMNSVRTSDGITFLFDAYKAPLWTLEHAFDVVAEAEATRKIIVLGKVSDMGKSGKRKHRQTIRDALAVADIVVFNSEMYKTVRKGLSDGDKARLHIFRTVRESSAFVKDIARNGDLILLKGSKGHLERIYLDHLGQIACWRESCGGHNPCMTCLRQNRAYLPKHHRPHSAARTAYAAANLSTRRYALGG